MTFNLAEYAWRSHGSCTIVPIAWPYDCDAKRRHPDHKVYRCVQHKAWWSETAPEWGE